MKEYLEGEASLPFDRDDLYITISGEIESVHRLLST